MIRFFDKKDKYAAISLWKEAFGDSEKTISTFLDRFGENMLVADEENTVVSMLTLFPVKIRDKRGRYVYAVATKKEFRDKGLAGSLIEYAKRFIEKNDENFLTILPQSDSLYGFYAKFGFSELKCVKRIDITVSFAEDSNIKAKKITAQEYYEYRKGYFADKKYVEWSAEMLDFFEKIYAGCYLKLSNGGKDIGYAFCYSDDDKVVISELLTVGEETEILSEIGRFFAKKHIVGVKESENGERFAMIYPKELNGCYFGIGMN